MEKKKVMSNLLQNYFVRTEQVAKARAELGRASIAGQPLPRRTAQEKQNG